MKNNFKIEKNSEELLFQNFTSAQDEMYAFEKIFALDLSFKKLTDELKFYSKASKFWKEKLKEQPKYEEINQKVESYLDKIFQNRDFIIAIKDHAQFPNKEFKNHIIHPVPVLYYKGNPDILENEKISVIGTRNISSMGKKRTKSLIEKIKTYSKKKSINIAIVSGLAKGVDTVALETAIDNGLKVIGVIGTPINEYYPKENKSLQDKIAREHLLISHVPFYRYKKEHFKEKKLHFIERNSIMAALSKVSIVVEASETSGTRSQARDCIKNNRKLFFLKSCYESEIRWIKNYIDSEKAILIDNNNLENELEKV